MGWNSWNTFGGNINEDVILETADAMVNEGLLDAGYEYLTIDDHWSEMKRDSNGMLVADRKCFPHGMKYVADYVHSKGLKFGMYSCCGPKTCGGYPGSFGHEFDDARYFASVGVDLLKYDNCYHPSNPSMLSYNRMSLALKASGRDILFSACNWGNEEVWKWARSAGIDMYRSTGDIFDTFESIRKLSESQISNLGYSGAGCFNDIDMLVVGLRGKGNVGVDDGCTDSQYRYHFRSLVHVHVSSYDRLRYKKHDSRNKGTFAQQRAYCDQPGRRGASSDVHKRQSRIQREYYMLPSSCKQRICNRFLQSLR